MSAEQIPGAAAKFDTTFQECDPDTFRAVSDIVKSNNGEADVLRLDALFRTGAPANGYTGTGGFNVLSYLDEAKRWNNEDALAYLIKLNYKDLLAVGWTFHNYIGSKKAVDALLAAGHTFSKEAADPGNPFWFKSFAMDADAFQKICERGTRFDVPIEIDSVSFLPIVQFANYHLVIGVPETLIAHCPNPNAQQADGQCVLHGAVRQGTVQRVTLDLPSNVDRLQRITRAFVDAGGDVDLVDSEGRSALNVACSLAYFCKAKALIEAGADPALKDKCGTCAEDLIARADLQELLELCSASRAKKAIDRVLKQAAAASKAGSSM